MRAATRSARERMGQGGIGAALVCGALIAGAVLAGPAMRSSAAPMMAEPAAGLSQEHLAALGEAGTVYLSGTWSGYVNFPLPDGTTAWSEEVTASFSCTGFVASSDGYIVTAGHCADVAEGKTALVDQFLSDEIDNGDITDAEAQAYVAAGAEGAWPVEGQKTGEAPVLGMKVYPAISISSDDSTSFTAVLQDDRPLGQGDVALFKIDTPAPLPMLSVATEDPATGQQVNAIGYPGNVTDLVSGNPQPTFAVGQVSGRQQTDGGPFTQIGVTMSPGMSGGPVINSAGEVVGTISFGPSGDTQQLNFAAARETVAALLSRNGVNPALKDADVSFRAGLAEYFDGKYHAAAADLAKAVAANPDNAIASQYQAKATAAFPQENTTGWVIWVIVGGAVLLLLVVGLVLLLVLRSARKRRRAAAAAAVAAPLAPGAPAPASPAPPAPAAPAVSAPPAPSAPAVSVPPAPTVLSPVAPAPPAPPVPLVAAPAFSDAPLEQHSAPAPVAVMPLGPVEPAAPPVPPTPTEPAAEPEAEPKAEPEPEAEPESAAPVPESAAPVAAPRHCSNCGAALAPEHHFCTACGRPAVDPAS